MSAGVHHLAPAKYCKTRPTLSLSQQVHKLNYGCCNSSLILFLAAVGPCLGHKGNVIELSNATGRIFTPLFPRNFPRGINCTWLITAPKGHFVKLSMKSFDMGYDCYFSSLYIRDGKSASSTLLDMYCGQEYEPSVFSSGRYLLVHFYSKFKEIDYYGSGFEAVFQAVNHCKIHFMENLSLVLFYNKLNLS